MTSAAPRNPPCIVCGRRRGHDAEAHETYRRESRRARNLLRRSWPRLPGLRRLLDWYARREPKPTRAPGARPLGWRAKIVTDGVVVHLPVWPDEEADGG